jgi:hypothetical protein
MRFKVTAPKNFEQNFERWIDALEMAKSLIPNCKGMFQEVRILENNELIWVYDRFHRHPQFMGAGTYNRLAKLFLQETLEDESDLESDRPSTE